MTSAARGRSAHRGGGQRARRFPISARPRFGLRCRTLQPGIPHRYWVADVRRRMSNVECRTPNAECRTSNAEHEAPDAFECRVRQRSTPPMQHGRTPPFRRTDRFAAGAAHPCDVRFSPRHPRGNRLYTLLRAALIQR
ncbi:conserved hypothetical protein [Burkholderia pseudomallei MSHR346]|nr:conserved hypothetical protein [Burkholderia pseudomallei MSHR346]